LEKFIPLPSPENRAIYPTTPGTDTFFSANFGPNHPETFQISKFFNLPIKLGIQESILQNFENILTFQA
jgi:hypothetical protein